MQPVKAIKKYGQNFLKNKEILNKIANSITTQKDDLIIEIGPGMGALTKYLSNKESELLGYEIDYRMKEYLDSYESAKTHIIYDDFLKRDLKKDLKNKHYQNIYVIANIPYYITSPILLKLVNSEIVFTKIVLLVQKEFAYRLVADANSKDYNAFTLLIDYYYNAKLLFIVGRENFVPVPKVDSAVVLLEKRNDKPIVNEDGYFKFIKEAFQNKRKTLKNNLKNYDWGKVLAILTELGYKENVRAEEISKTDFKKIWESL